MKIALRTQQIIADETNVANVIDPLGGSYYVESLTDQFERDIFAVLDEIEAGGGTVRLIEQGWFQRRIADFAYQVALDKQSGDKVVIGVNRHAEPEAAVDIATHAYDPRIVDRQLSRLRRVRQERDEERVQGLLQQLRRDAADESVNLMPVTVDLVKAGASMGDIVETLRALWGTYEERPVF